MTTTKMFRTWNERISSGTFTKAQIINFYNGVYSIAWGDLFPGGKKSALTQSEAEQLVTRLEHDRVTVTGTQAEQGRRWLAANKKRLRLPDLDFSTITHFEFVGADEVNSNYYRTTFAPRYRGYFPDGSTFSYAVTSWQSGQPYAEWSHRVANPVAA